MLARKIFLTLALMSMLVLGAASTSHADGNFMVRIQGTGVLPDADADVLSSNVIIPGAGMDVDDEFIPTATLTYFLTDNYAVELFCCFAEMEAGATGISGVGEIANFWVFPPVLTAQYHFTGMGGFKPYVGVGLSYMHFFDEKAVGAFAGEKLKMEDSFGLALQAGADMAIGGGWHLNVDVKKIFIDVDAEYSNGIKADIDVDPVIVSAGIGYRFDIGSLFGRSAPLK